MILYDFQYGFVVGNLVMYGSLLLQMVKHNDFSRVKLLREEFGIDLREGLTTVDARVLPSPMVILWWFVCLSYLVYIKQ